MMKYIYIFLFYSFFYADSMQIDASDWDDWVYINLYLGSEVFPSDPQNSLGWDIACHRYHFRTNSGLSGVGNGGAYIDSINTWTSLIYSNLTLVPSDAVFITDTLVNTFYDINEHEGGLEGIANPALEKWGTIDVDNNYLMQYSNNQYIVKNGIGDKYYKFWVVNYYNENGTSGHITIVYDEVDSATLTTNNISPVNIELLNNYPNPFNPITVVPFTLDFSGYVEIEIINLNGKVISKIFSDYLEVGLHEVIWDTRENGCYVPSGIYQYRIFFNDKMVGQRKITLIK